MILTSLPHDALYRVLRFLSVREIICLRLVCKDLGDLTLHRVVWHDAYTYAKLPRPLGPLDSHSREFLENTLVKSTQVGIKWCKQALRITSKATWFEPEWSALQGDQWEVVSGSWLIIPLIRGSDILCYDLERGLRHVVYHADNALILSFRSTTSEAADGGYIMHAMVMEHNRSSALFSQKLLLIRFSSEGPMLEYTMVIPVDIIGEGMSQLSAGQRLLCMSDHLTGTLNLAMDTHSRVLYQFPPPSSVIDPTFGTKETYLKRLIATETHILAMFTPLTKITQLSDDDENSRQIIQAFAIPQVDDTTTSSPTLQLTHEGHCNLDIERVSLLCDSMTNAVTRQTQIKFLAHCMRLNLTKYFAHRVILSPPLPGQKLGDISLSTEELFSVPGYANTMKFTTSFDGHARGICVLHNERDGTEFYGFTIDASSMNRPCTGIVGPGVDIRDVEATESFPSSLRMTWNVKLAFDGNLGRVCYRKRGKEGRNVLAIIDLA
ncbi:hypothetical protein AZE42_08957 [Rhizopogon vesiculosus]|uniref:F-box domain-containing protein n=1 Tax=Rhizopogon vesiculosus TaxID=180088 RepID=A0A1J8R8E7_9AGAM|nr:hypothetical protein AZE42_08957 [Rhizopogon vesiculosus]